MEIKKVKAKKTDNPVVAKLIVEVLKNSECNASINGNIEDAIQGAFVLMSKAVVEDAKSGMDVALWHDKLQDMLDEAYTVVCTELGYLTVDENGEPHPTSKMGTVVGFNGPPM